jgi:transcriptional regulator with XRE-family HTH domain
MQTKKTIRALRKKVGLTQRAIAEELGCTQPHVHYLETAKVKNPRPSAHIADGLRRLCEKHADKLAVAGRRNGA